MVFNSNFRHGAENLGQLDYYKIHIRFSPERKRAVIKNPIVLLLNLRLMSPKPEIYLRIFPNSTFSNPFFLDKMRIQDPYMGESFLEPAELWQFFPTSICRTSKLSVISGWKYVSRQERGHGSGNMEIVGNIGSPRKRPPPAAGIPLRDLLVLPLRHLTTLVFYKYTDTT